LHIPLTVVHSLAGAESDRYEARWVLVRPDQFVAWVSQDAHIDAAQAQQVMRRVTGNASIRAS
jgi:hypothetical protein